jgi:hypothetical protein
MPSEYQIYFNNCVSNYPQHPNIDYWQILGVLIVLDLVTYQMLVGIEVDECGMRSQQASYRRAAIEIYQDDYVLFFRTNTPG